VHDGVGVAVEVQPFLADRRSHQHKRPEGRVEAVHDLLLARHLLTRLALLLGEPDGKVGAHRPIVMDFHALVTLIDADLVGPES